MSVVNYPARSVTTCDACGCTSEGKGVTFRQEMGLHFKQSALDYQGSACADGSTHFDFCDDCGNRVREAINVAVERIKVKP